MRGLVKKTDIRGVTKERQELQEKLDSINESGAERHQIRISDAAAAS
jgi:hypothetical protein